jgi:hypothetical protein
MSTSSSANKTSHGHLSLPFSAFKDQVSEDPYLSGPSDLEDFPIDRNPAGASQGYRAEGLSSVSPPTVTRVDRRSMDGHEHDGYPHLQSSHNFEYDLSDPGILSSVQTSPGDEYLLEGLDNQIAAAEFDRETSQEDMHGYGVFNSGHEVASNLLNSDPTNSQQLDNDFSSMINDPREAAHGRLPHGDQPSKLDIPDTGTNINNWSVNPSPISAHSPSPIVKVSEYTRGDSPIRDDSDLERRRNSHSSIHLSPSHGSDDVEDKDGADDDTGRSTRSGSMQRADDGSWVPNPTTGQRGIDPTSRGDITVLSPEQLEQKRRIDEMNLKIQSWSVSVSAANSEGEDQITPSQLNRGRPRATSCVDPSRQDYFSLKKFDDSNIPGPGTLIDEPMVGVDSESETPSDSSHADSSKNLDEDEEPLARQFIRSPWRDAPHFPAPLPTKEQPETSRDAMEQFLKEAKAFDTISRVATWGTKKLSDEEVNSLLESDSFLKSLSISKSSLLKFLPRRSNNARKRDSQTVQMQSKPAPEDQLHQDSQVNSVVPQKLSRKRSLGRSNKSSAIGTTSILAAGFAGQMAASIGSHSSLQPPSPTHRANSRGPTSFVHRLRTRSKSEVPYASPGLLELTTRGLITHEAKALSPVTRPPPLVDSRNRRPEEVDDADDDDDDLMDENGLVMDLSPPFETIIPTYDGFKEQIIRLNPRLEGTLVHRFAQEQQLRYKKLIDAKNKHAISVRNGNCAAGKRCFASGGQAEMLPPRVTSRDPNATYCQFQVGGHGPIDDESQRIFDSAVTAAVFPSGVPLPPVQRLPAEFECSLCFKVKRPQKPSDWTKHVHEDISPFTCTFPECNEPKSFKRKADWVRHENERHRRLEGWICDLPDCGHKCYRKDNFVQHLVREHKRPEPKIKKGKSPAAAEDEQEIAELWKEVDRCRTVTSRSPDQEPCRFCGNVLNDWKKLTVHLARHLEQIALPVLRLADGYHPTANKATEPSSAPANPSPSPVGIKAETSLDTEIGQVSYDSRQFSEQSGLHLPQKSALARALPKELSGSSGTTCPPATPYPTNTSSLLNPQYTPVHRNSVSYPPPYNAMPSRPDPMMIAAHPVSAVNPFRLTLSTGTASMSYDPQQPVYASPTADNIYMFPGDNIPTMAYDNTDAMDYQNVNPTLEIQDSSNPVYMQHHQSPSFGFQ